MNIQKILHELKEFFCIGLTFIIFGLLGYITTNLFGEYGFPPIWSANLCLIIGITLTVIISVIYIVSTLKLSQPLEPSENKQVSVPAELKIPLVCPKCGTKLRVIPICPNCGYKFEV